MTILLVSHFIVAASAATAATAFVYVHAIYVITITIIIIIIALRLCWGFSPIRHSLAVRFASSSRDISARICT